MGWMADEAAAYEAELWAAEQWENEHTEDPWDSGEGEDGLEEEEW